MDSHPTAVTSQGVPIPSLFASSLRSMGTAARREPPAKTPNIDSSSSQSRTPFLFQGRAGDRKDAASSFSIQNNSFDTRRQVLDYSATEAARDRPTPFDSGAAGAGLSQSISTSSPVAAASRSKPSTGTSPSGQLSDGLSPPTTADYAEIEQKQSELRSAVEYRIALLEQTVALREEDVHRLQGQLRRMEEDYLFNYNLIGERDAALEEAATQLQRLYRELKRVTDEGARMEAKAAAAEAEVGKLRQRVREVEAEREGEALRVQKEFALKERHLAETVRAKEAALEDEKQKSHEFYLSRMQEVEEGRAVAEGRTINITTEWEDRYQQLSRRMQEELESTKRRLHTAKEERSQAEKERMTMHSKYEELRQAYALLEQRHTTATEEFSEVRRQLELKLTESSSLLGKSLSTAEQAIREESQKVALLEVERSSLQSQLAEVQQRLQHVTSQRDEDAARLHTEARELRDSYRAAQEAMTEMERTWRNSERQLHAEVELQKDAAARASAGHHQVQDELRQVKEKLLIAQDACAAERRERERAESDARRWKEEEAKTASTMRQELFAFEEKRASLEHELQVATDEMERQRRKALDLQERSQSESARLTRELHASEAARRALEDQYHLSQDRNSQEGLISTLRYDKEVLEKRVLELERVNGEVREQVANFTMELQSDPLVRTAKETQHRVQELQQDLLVARDDNQRLRDTLKEKDEELARNQMELLKAQMLVGGSEWEGRDGLTTLLSRQQQKFREEFTEMRRLYEDMRRQVKKERRRNMRSVSRTRSPSASSGNGENDLREPERAHRHERRKPATSGSSPDPLLMASSGGQQQDKVEALLQEVEVWRRKCAQLEKHLQDVLRERDRLRKELHLSQQDATALTSEKQSLIDLNSLLKAQLREAYRAAFETAPLSASSAMSTEASADVIAAALQLLQKSGPRPTAKASSALSSASAPNAHGVNPCQWAVDSVELAKEPIATHSGARSALNDSSSSGKRSEGSAQRRLAVLEEEIRSVKSQIAATMSRPGAPCGGSGVPAGRPSSAVHGSHRAVPGTQRPAVVRKGEASVRHYGYV